jgi:hypothetical protein
VVRAATPRRAGSPGLAARLVELGRLGTKWESPALARAFHGSLLLPCARLHLRKYGIALVAGMWMLSWGSSVLPARRTRHRSPR